MKLSHPSKAGPGRSFTRDPDGPPQKGTSKPRGGPLYDIFLSTTWRGIPENTCLSVVLEHADHFSDRPTGRKHSKLGRHFSGNTNSPADGPVRVSQGPTRLGPGVSVHHGPLTVRRALSPFPVHGEKTMNHWKNNGLRKRRTVSHRLATTARKNSVASRNILRANNVEHDDL